MVVRLYDDNGKMLYGYNNIESIWYSNGSLYMEKELFGCVCIKVARFEYSYFTIEGRILVPFNK